MGTRSVAVEEDRRLAHNWNPGWLVSESMTVLSVSCSKGVGWCSVVVVACGGGGGGGGGGCGEANRGDGLLVVECGGGVVVFG